MCVVAFADDDPGRIGFEAEALEEVYVEVAEGRRVLRVEVVEAAAARAEEETAQRQRRAATAEIAQATQDYAALTASRPMSAAPAAIDGAVSLIDELLAERESEAETLAQETADRFGPLPQEVVGRRIPEEQRQSRGERMVVERTGRVEHGARGRA